MKIGFYAPKISENSCLIWICLIFNYVQFQAKGMLIEMQNVSFGMKCHAIIFLLKLQ